MLSHQCTYIRHWLKTNYYKNLNPKSILDNHHQTTKTHSVQAIFSELTLLDGELILKGEKILLPENLQDEAINLSHMASHQGQRQIKQCLCYHFWFPRMDHIIAQHVEQCIQCQQYTQSQQKAPLTPILILVYSWENVSLDLFGQLPYHSHILVSHCNLSRFPDTKVVKSSSSEHVLPALAETYNDFGNPATNKADNGPPFNSEAFKTFSDKRGISIKHTPPYHPQANEAEYFMKPLGKPVKIAIGTNKPIKEAVTNLLTSYLI